MSPPGPGLVVAVLMGAALAGLAGLGVPRLVATLPARAEGPGDDRSAGTGVPSYAEVAAAPGLGPRCAVLSALVAALLVAAVAPDPWAVPLVLLVPVAVALAVLDARTRLLPRVLVLPATVALLVAAVALAGLSELGWLPGADHTASSDLVRGVVGLVLARSTYWVLWFVRSAGMGFGDVRLAALVGLALAHLGWAELVVGLYAGFLVFGVPAALLALLRGDPALLRTAYPYGPFMLAGAVLGVLAGDPVLHAIGWV